MDKPEKIKLRKKLEVRDVSAGEFFMMSGSKAYQAVKEQAAIMQCDLYNQFYNLDLTQPNALQEVMQIQTEIRVLEDYYFKGRGPVSKIETKKRVEQNKAHRAV